MTSQKVRRCRCCDQVKAVADFYKNFAGKNGESSICKKCENDRIHNLRELEQKALGTTRAGPRDFVSTKPYEPKDNTYYRNTGNKHIPSRGFV